MPVLLTILRPTIIVIVVIIITGVRHASVQLQIVARHHESKARNGHLPLEPIGENSNASDAS